MPGEIQAGLSRFMASPVAASDAAALSDIASATSARFEANAAALDSASSSSAPAEPAAPPAAAPESPSAPAATAPAAQPQPGQTPAGSPPASQPAFNVTDPAAKRYLEMHGGNVEAALAKALLDNNRLAELSREQQPQQPPAQAQPPTAPEPPEPAPLDPQAVQADVDRYVGQDQECNRLANLYGQNRVRLSTIANDLPKLDEQIRQLQYRLSFPEVKDDPMRVAEIRSELNAIGFERNNMQLERFTLQQDQTQLDAAWTARASGYRQHIESTHRQQVEAARQKAAFDDEINRSASALAQAWPGALAAAIQNHKIPESQVAFFKEDLRAYAMAHDGVITNANEFIDRQGKRFMERLDQSHRERSAEYARLSQARAAQPGPATAAPVVTTEVQKTGDPIKDAMARKEELWARLGTR